VIGLVTERQGLTTGLRRLSREPPVLHATEIQRSIVTFQLLGQGKGVCLGQPLPGWRDPTRRCPIRDPPRHGLTSAQGCSVGLTMCRLEGRNADGRDGCPRSHPAERHPCLPYSVGRKSVAVRGRRSTRCASHEAAGAAGVEHRAAVPLDVARGSLERSSQGCHQCRDLPRQVERVTGIEPAPPAWKTPVGRPVPSVNVRRRRSAR
jgi:hypothetical protein